ncbi:MAG: hypothetical protein ACTH2Y_04415 [Corynebacterium sp.]|uniref:hypothetical protein n=1 Tax=unclassified Corynebacterium TaxID=2624378 RepID=UPI003F8DA645
MFVKTSPSVVEASELAALRSSSEATIIFPADFDHEFAADTIPLSSPANMTVSAFRGVTASTAAIGGT